MLCSIVEHFDVIEDIGTGQIAQPHQAISDDTAKQIDEEVRRIIDECYGMAQKLLEENVDKLHVMADALMLYETIDADQFPRHEFGITAEPRPTAGD